MDYLEQNVLFITATFQLKYLSVFPIDPASRLDPRVDFRSIDRNSGDLKIHPLDAFSFLYLRAVQKMLGPKNIGRKKKWQPIVFAWVDFEGSREAHVIHDPKGAHVHGIALCRPGKAKDFASLFGVRGFYKPAMPIIDNIDVRFYHRSFGPLHGLARYCSKGHRKFYARDDDHARLEVKRGLRAVLPPQY